MFETTAELLRKIELGEDSFLELKEIRMAGQRVSAPSRDGLADELAAIANAFGGVCVLGVDDKTRQVLGIPLEDLDRVEAWVREICHDSVEPPLLPTISRLKLQNPDRKGGDDCAPNQVPTLPVQVLMEPPLLPTSTRLKLQNPDRKGGDDCTPQKVPTLPVQVLVEPPLLPTITRLKLQNPDRKGGDVCAPQKVPALPVQALMEPPLLPTSTRLKLQNPDRKGGDDRAPHQVPTLPVEVLKIELARSSFVHRSPGGYFHRTGSSKQEMPLEYLSRLNRFDEQLVHSASLNDLREKLCRRFSPEDFLRHGKLARQDEQGVWRPTVAGILMATDEPARFIPGARIEAVAFNDSEETSEMAGPLDRQVAEACRFVARHMKVTGNRAQFDLTAVFEAMVNAVAHRDYASYGSKIQLRMYPDRLELSSPGGLPGTMSIDGLALRQSTRNEVLTSLLDRCPVPGDLPAAATGRSTMMHKRGEGVPIILERTLALAGRLPEYRLLDSEELLLTIPAAHVEQP